MSDLFSTSMAELIDSDTDNAMDQMNEAASRFVSDYRDKCTEIEMLRSMCKAAALEIESKWEFHCDTNGLGPINLISRLKGDLPPDFYEIET